MQEIVIPESKERVRHKELESMEVGEVKVISRKDRQVYSDTACVFKKFTEKVFRTSTKGQPEGKAIIWRVK